MSRVRSAQGRSADASDAGDFPTQHTPTALEKLYARIPAVDCIPGCTDCCGFIPLGTKAEIAAFGPFPLERTPIGVVSMNEDCPNSRAGNCRIHDTRPFVCRLFGAVDIAAIGSSESRMVCPHGRKPVKPLTQREAAELTREYFEIVAVDGKADRPEASADARGAGANPK